MNLAHIVLLLAVTIAVVAIAGYLIAIVLILKNVVNRLTTILGGVEAVTRTVQPVDGLLRDINADLDAGRRTMDDAVARIEETRVPVGTAGDGSARHDRHAAGGGVGTGTAAAPPAPPAAPGESDSSEWPPPGRPGPPPGPLWDR